MGLVLWVQQAGFTGYCHPATLNWQQNNEFYLGPAHSLVVWVFFSCILIFGVAVVDLPLVEQGCFSVLLFKIK